jgi:hypothetical protein
MTTPCQQRFVNSIIETAKVDKAYANWAVNDFAQLDPYQLGNLKELVKAELELRKQVKE